MLDVRDRTDADDRVAAERVQAASVVYFSGGNPAYLTATLNGTALWKSVLDGLDRGMGYIGCSAGMAALGRKAPDSTRRRAVSPLLGRGSATVPADVVRAALEPARRLRPRPRGSHRRHRSADDLLIAVDEQTALVGDGEHGRSSASAMPTCAMSTAGVTTPWGSRSASPPFTVSPLVSPAVSPSAVPSVVPPAGFEPAHTAPEADALSPELRGLGTSGGYQRIQFMPRTEGSSWNCGGTSVDERVGWVSDRR